MDSRRRLAQVFKALSIGVVLDLVATLIVGMVLGLVFALVFLLQGVPDQEVGERIRTLASSRFWLTVSLVLGALISVAAGFVAAHHLRANIFPWLGLMGTLLALLGYAGTGAEVPASLARGAGFVTLFSVMLGGWLWQWAQK